MSGLTIFDQGDDALAFFVPGKPQTAGSKTAFVPKGSTRAIVTESGDRKAKRSWRGDIRDAARAATGFEAADWPSTDALAVTFVVVRRRPKAHLNARGDLHPWALALRPTQRPDTTKLIRAAEDALEGVLWADDAALVDQHGFKTYGDQAGLGVVAEGLLLVVRRAGAYEGPSVSVGLAPVE